MKAAVTDGKGNVKLMEISEPTPNPYQCLCRIEACATCTGTDKKLVNGRQIPLEGNYPAILGHESVGTVIQCGSSVKNIKVGDRFLRPAAAYPRTFLDNYASWMGGFAEYGLVTDNKAMTESDPASIIDPYSVYQQMIPQEIKIEAPDATMLITLKEIASSVRDLDIGFGSKVVVLGTGAVGMSMCYFAKLFGAYPVIVIGRRDQPLEDCRKAGADFVINTQKENITEKIMDYTAKAGIDFALDAAGDTSLLIEAGSALAKYGSLCSYTSGSGLSIDKIAEPGRRWKYIKGGPDETSAHQYLLDLVRMQTIPLKNFYSHTIPFDDFEKGFKMLVEKQAFKIAFVMQ